MKIKDLLENSHGYKVGDIVKLKSSVQGGGAKAEITHIYGSGKMDVKIIEGPLKGTSNCIYLDDATKA